MLTPFDSESAKFARSLRTNYDKKSKVGRTRKVCEFGYEEISDLTGIPIETLKKKVSREEFSLENHQSIIDFVVGVQLINKAKQIGPE